MNSSFAYCEEDSDYEAYWPVIQIIYEFLAKYGRDEYWYAFEETGHAYWTSVEGLCRRTRKRLSSGQESSPEDIAVFANQIKGELDGFATQADAPNKTPFVGNRRQLPYYPQRFQQTMTSWQLRRRKIEFKFRYTLQLVRMYLFDWYKLKTRRVRQEIEGPAIAEQLAFRPFTTGYPR
jgi:hypothetical protein